MIVILCGPPACGKTTLANELRDRLADSGVDAETLHSDDIDRNTYDRLYERVADADGHWILDGTFYSEEIRDRFRELEDVFVAWIDAERDTCIERNESRADPIADQGIYVMYATFEEPDPDCHVDTESLSVAESADRLESAVLEWIDS